MKKCKSCQKEIDPKATKCPFCQTDQRNWFAKHKVLSGFLILVILVIILISFNSGKSKSITTTSNPSVPTPPAQTVIAVSAYQLAGDYHANEVSADNKYKNNLLEISGTIDSIGKDILGYPFVTLSNGSGTISLSDIECSFDQTDSNNSALSSLSKGQKLTVEGTGSGMALTQVMVKNCSIVK